MQSRANVQAMEPADVNHTLVFLAIRRCFPLLGWQLHERVGPTWECHLIFTIDDIGTDS